MFIQTETPYYSPDHYFKDIDGILLDLINPESKPYLLEPVSVPPSERPDLVAYETLDNVGFYWIPCLLSGSVDLVYKTATKTSLEEFLIQNKIEG